jgi:hypothetical protein
MHSTPASSKRHFRDALIEVSIAESLRGIAARTITMGDECQGAEQ